MIPTLAEAREGEMPTPNCMDATLREIQSFHPMHLAGAHGISQPPMECSKCAIAYLLARLAKAEVVTEFADHEQKCIRHRYEAGEPTPEGGYRVKYAGKWYQAKPIDESPKCDCGFGDALATWQEAP